MKKTFAKVASFALALALMVPCFASCGGGATNYAENNTKIKIGMSGPLTGGAAVYGTAVENSVKLAIEEVNAIAMNEGELGMQFEFKMSDDKHDPTLVAQSYSALYEGGMQISLGTVTTGPALEFKEYSKDDNVFALTPSASGDAVPEYDNAFQMCFADSKQGTASANYFNDNYKGLKVGVFYKSDDEYSTGILAEFEKALDQSFGTITKASFKGDESDFAQQVQNLKECDVIFMPIYYTPASQFMTAGKDVIKANAVYYGCDGLDGVDAVDNFDINTIPQEVSYLSHFNSGATEGAAKAYIDAYVAKYGADAPLNQFGAAAYDCVWAIYEALKVAKANGKSFDVTTSASEFCDILKEVFTSESFVYHGVTGAAVTEDGRSNISWAADGTVNKDAVKYVVKAANAN